jgi:DNA gyrase inhibitor GyrI
MREFKIRIEKLPSMRVAYYTGFAKHPEMEAWGTLLTWAQGKGLVSQPLSFRRFGFNNPPPWGTEGEEYGYECWITVDEQVEASGEVGIKAFPGSLCAATSIERLADIGNAWETLYQWVEDSGQYDHAHMDGLEEVISPLDTPEEELAFHLYLPIVEV